MGIIPANTGRMLRVRVTEGFEWDHPREYGENDIAVVDGAPYMGSSPRIRGEYPDVEGELELKGIIPANTGRICGSCCPWPRTQDHPREYGENPLRAVLQWFVAGSSPRIRGESLEESFRQSFDGIIPANTGRMCLILVGMRGCRDHPREYGENLGDLGDG
mgnify:CR=1 FL=1